ncbi:unnamed protein product, partial [Iphiclides podalirius]
MPTTTRVTTQSKHGIREERSDSSDPEYEDSTVESRADGGAVPAFHPASACAESGAPVGMEKILATVMETFVRTQAEKNRILIETMRSLQGTTESTPTASSPVASTSAAPGGNFSRCTARFNGEARDAETVEAFIEAVQVYKDCADVSDEHALRGFPMLLEGNAAVCWRGARNGVSSWSEAVVRLRTMYGSPPPAYKVLREIFAAEQQGDERGEVFVAKVRAIIAKLPYSVPETMQIDIIYGLLHRRIKKRLARDGIISLDHLSEKVRVTEEAIEEIKLPSRSPAFQISTSSTALPRTRTVPLV